MEHISTKDIRYIKLGRSNCWADASLDQGEMHFGFDKVPHELCLAGAWEKAITLLIEGGKNPGAAKRTIAEVRDFYTLGEKCLWFTFARGSLWWTYARSGVHWAGPSTGDHGCRFRRTIDCWSKSDLAGKPLLIHTLSSRLTAVAAFRGTICGIDTGEYLIRRINGIEEPVIEKARQARESMLAYAGEMIAGLHWADFEDLIDLIFARSGWQRETRVGGTQKDVDMEVREPATAARGFVQVKSRASQADLDDYIERYKATGGYDHMFFVCHSPKGVLKAGKHDNVHIWERKQLADLAIRAGLYEWLIERSM